MKELNTQPIVEFIENYVHITGKPMLFECPSHGSTFSFTKQNDEIVWEQPSNADTRM